MTDPTAPIQTDESLPVIARKRGMQTLLQSLGVDILVGVLIVAAPLVAQSESWEQLARDWRVWTFLLCKSAIQAVVAWGIRRYVDRSGFARDSDSGYEPRHAAVEGSEVEGEGEGV